MKSKVENSPFMKLPDALAGKMIKEMIRKKGRVEVVPSELEYPPALVDGDEFEIIEEEETPRRAPQVNQQPAYYD